AGPYALDRVQQHRPDAAGDDDDDLHGVADPGEEHDDGHQDGRRYGAQELQDRFRDGPHAREAADDEAEGHAEDGRREVAEEQPGDAGHHVGGDPLGGPHLAAGLQDGAQRRPVDVGAAGGGEPPAGHEEDGQTEGEQQPQQGGTEGGTQGQDRRTTGRRAFHTVLHGVTSPRTDWCQASERRATARAPAVMRTPLSPVTATSAYMSGTAWEVCATAMRAPSPGVPMTSSAVTARTRATAAASRTPVMTQGRAVGHSTWRIRAQVPRP